MKNIALYFVVFILMSCNSVRKESSQPIRLEIQQLTHGNKHHFFGYIGQCLTIPWNAGNRYVLGLEIDRIDRMPHPQDSARVFIIDTKNDNEIIYLDKTNAWNPQQGTMFFWNPNAAETQFFFNDRDVETGEVYTVLYDIKLKKRIKEYRYDNVHIANGGVASDGSFFMALNYGRLARLRLVTGYPGALDWSKDDLAPEDDGIFKVDIETGEKELIVSYKQMEDEIKKKNTDYIHSGLFVNHTLLNRNASRLYFFARAGWGVDDVRDVRTNIPFTVNLDGSNLKQHDLHIGGHPEWGEGTIMIGREGKRQIFYDVDKQEVVGQIGTSELFPNPEGDISLSPEGDWFVNGFMDAMNDGSENFYAFYRQSDSTYIRSIGMGRGSYRGDIRIDPAPRWNRTSDAILVPGIDSNQTRQMFVIKLIEE